METMASCMLFWSTFHFLSIVYSKIITKISSITVWFCEIVFTVKNDSTVL